MFRFYNANPLNRQINDCVVRAVSLAEEMSWDKTYAKLSTIARLQGLLMDDVNFVEPYLNEQYQKICYRCEDCDITVGEFAEDHPKGTYLVTMRGHITCVIDGHIYDTWNCSGRKVWCAWAIK